MAIGVDSDQYQTADPSVKDVIMTSMLKNVDVAVYDYLKAVDGGDFPSGTRRYDLKVDGVGYSTSGGQVDDINEQARRLQAADHRRRDQGPDDPVIWSAAPAASHGAPGVRARGPCVRLHRVAFAEV